MTRLRHWFVAPLLVVAGCASSPYWERTWEGAVEPPIIHTVGASPWGAGVQGWTVCDKAARRCTVFLVANADRDCVLEHEMRHVAGFDHPRYPRAFICGAPSLDLLRVR